MMNRMVRQRLSVEEKGKAKVGTGTSSSDLIRNTSVISQVQDSSLDWTRLPSDIVISMFTRLNNWDRASLRSTCRTWRSVGASPCLWKSLDLRSTTLDEARAYTLSNECAKNIQKIRFRGDKTAEVLFIVGAKNLLEVSGEFCSEITDYTVFIFAKVHRNLESIEFGPELCGMLIDDAIKYIAEYCRKLKKLRLSGLKKVGAEVVAVLAKNCPQLCDIGFIDCTKIDEAALGKVVSLRYLSVAGTSSIDWPVAAEHWSKLPELIGLDVSRTDISLEAASRLLTDSKKLEIFSAVKCPLLGENTSFSSTEFSGIAVYGYNGIFYASADMKRKEKDILSYLRDCAIENTSVEQRVWWIEWILAHSLLRLAQSKSKVLDSFWMNGGVKLLYSLMQSTQDDVQERAVRGIGSFILVDGQSSEVDNGRVEAVIREGGIRIFLKLASESGLEGMQSAAARVIANLVMNTKAAKAVAEEEGIILLADLVKSTSKYVAEEAATALWNLSVGDEYKSAIAQAGGPRALVELILRWPIGFNSIQHQAAGALANLATDEKCSKEVAKAGGVYALVKIARVSKYSGAQEKVARALANLAAHGDSNDIIADIGQEHDALKYLIRFTESTHRVVKLEAASALCNLTSNEKNRESIAALDGVKTLVTLVKFSRSIVFPSLQEKAAGILWGLSTTEEISIAIGKEGGIPPLFSLLRSAHENVYEAAVGALWTLVFNPSNVLLISDAFGIFLLGQFCRRRSVSKAARFMAALALAYMFDGRVVWSTEPLQIVHINANKIASLENIEDFITSIVEPQYIAAASVSFAPTMLAQVSEQARIVKAGYLKCSDSEIERFVTMLRNPSPKLKACAAFALLQFTIPGSRHAMHHARLVQNAGGARILRTVGSLRELCFAISSITRQNPPKDRSILYNSVSLKPNKRL